MSFCTCKHDFYVFLGCFFLTLVYMWPTYFWCQPLEKLEKLALHFSASVVSAWKCLQVPGGWLQYRSNPCPAPQNTSVSQKTHMKYVFSCTKYFYIFTSENQCSFCMYCTVWKTSPHTPLFIFVIYACSFTERLLPFENRTFQTGLTQ